MNFRYVACWLTGGWIAGSLFMIMVATENFRSVDRLLAAPAGASALAGKLGHDDARTFLRYHVSEQNRWYFEHWEWMQIVLLGALLAAAWQGRSLRIAAALMLALLAAQRFYITPEIVRIGRLIDFAPQAPERQTFWQFHGAYAGIEVTKLALGFFLQPGFCSGGSASGDLAGLPSSHRPPANSRFPSSWIFSCGPASLRLGAHRPPARCGQ